MPNNEDWRYEKAKALGLIDTRPVTPLPRGRPSAEKAPPTAAKPSLAPARASAEPAAAASAPPISSAPLRIDPTPKDPARTSNYVSYAQRAAIVAGVFLSAGAGWILHANLGSTPTVQRLPPTLPLVAGHPARIAPRIDTVTPTPIEMSPAASLPPAPQLPLPVNPVGADATTATPDKILPRSKREPTTPGTSTIVPVATNTKPLSAKPATSHVARHSIGIAATPSRAAQPSFNCSRAQTSVNQMICNDPVLAGLDATMASEYRRAVRRSDLQTEFSLDREQAAFLNARSECQTSRCVARIYLQRIDKLRQG